MLIVPKEFGIETKNQECISFLTMYFFFLFLFQNNSESLNTFSSQKRCSEPLVMAARRDQAGQKQSCFIYKDDLILPAFMEAPSTF